MPCRSDDYGEDLARSKYELDKVTRLLCELCGNLEMRDILYSSTTPELQKWWAQHKEKDRQREEAERDMVAYKLRCKEAEIKKLEAEVAKLKGR